LHEIKFDGYRVQLHKEGKRVKIYSRRGADFTTLPLPNGVPDFRTLHSRTFDPSTLAIWAFDLLQHNGTDMRPHPLTVRKLKLGTMLRKYNHPALRYSESFISGAKLLEQAQLHGLEGIVCKRRDAPYRSGQGDQIKVKTTSWREANKDRGDLFYSRR